MSRWWLALSCVSFAAATAACSNGSGALPAASDSGSGASASGTQACTDVATAYCGKLAGCSQIAIAADYGDQATCISRRTQNCLNGLMAAGTGTTPSNIEACVAAYATWSCTDFMNGVPPAACAPQPGSGATGAPCAFDPQCQSAFCQIPYGGECGICAAPPAAGSSCANLQHCPSGLICTANTRLCTTHATAGQACDDDTTCGYGLDCVGSDATTGVAGLCFTAVAEAGAPCDHLQKTDAGCASAQDLYCAKDGTCQPYGSATSGQPCKFVGDSGTYTYCTGGAACLVTPTTAQTGTCAGPAADGMSCDTSADDSCVAPATCVGTPVDGGVAGTCIFRSAGACTSGDP